MPQIGTVDPNEVHAYLRVCQDQGSLEALDGLLEERIRLLEQPPQGFQPESAFMQTTQHGSGTSQVPMTGPDPGGVGSTSVYEQAAINDALLQSQVAEGRTPGQFNRPREVALTPDALPAMQGNLFQTPPEEEEAGKEAAKEAAKAASSTPKERRPPEDKAEAKK